VTSQGALRTEARIMFALKAVSEGHSPKAFKLLSYGLSVSFHFSIMSLSSPGLKLTRTRIELSHLKGNMLSSATRTGK
jgi:hypothetical protein